MNKNELARAVAKLEGKRISVNIAQIKEILKCVECILGYDLITVQPILKKKVRRVKRATR